MSEPSFTELPVEEGRSLLNTEGFICDNEDALYWIGAEARTEAQAVAEIVKTFGLDEPEAEFPPATTRVRCRIGVTQHDEHWLKLDPEGPLEAWQVNFDA